MSRTFTDLSARPHGRPIARPRSALRRSPLAICLPVAMLLVCLSVIGAAAFNMEHGRAEASSVAPVPGDAIDVRSRGAVGDGVTDDGPVIQALFDSVATGATIVFPAGYTFAHNQVLRLEKAGVRITGGGVLLATNEQSSSVWLGADNVSADNLTFRMKSTTKRWVAYEQMKLRVRGSSGITISNVLVDGSAAAGIFIGNGASNFTLTDVTVQNTRADGIHMTSGANHGSVIRPTVINPGDDGVAVVSYMASTLPTCNHITVTSPRIIGQTWGRGLTVVGGDSITYTNVYVERSSAASIYVAAESEWDTKASTNVIFDGGSITAANQTSTVDHGAVVIYTSQTGATSGNITIRNITISDTRSTAAREMSVLQGAGTLHHVALENIHLTGGPKTVLYSTATPSTVRMTGIVDQGNTLPDQIGW